MEGDSLEIICIISYNPRSGIVTKKGTGLEEGRARFDSRLATLHQHGLGQIT